MTRILRRAITHPRPALGSTLSSGLTELLALQRSRHLDRRVANPSRSGASAAG